MKNLLLLAAAILSCIAANAQIDDPKIDFRDFQAAKKQGSEAVRSFIYNGNDEATTFDPAWANRFQTVLDSVMLANPGSKGASVAVYTPEEGMWTGVSGISSPGVPVTSDMRFGIGSNTKLFIAIALVRLQEQGVLTLDDHLYQWLPPIDHVDSTTTIRQLLTHQSGIFDFWNDNPSWITSIWADTSRFWTPQEVLALIGAPHFAPGKGFRYSNTNYLLAALIIEAATGESWVQMLHELIFDPLDLDSTFVGAYEPRNGPVAAEWDSFTNHLITDSPMTAEYSMVHAAGGMLATASEMVQWYNALFNGSVISGASLQEVLDFDPSSLYGLAILEGEAYTRNYTHSGGMLGYGSLIVYDIQRKAIICFLFNDRYTWAEKILPMMDVFFLEYPRQPSDAGIAGIISPWEHICTSEVSPEVELKNFGGNTLTSVSIHYIVNEGPAVSYEWTGSLNPDQTEMVILPSITLDNGSYSITCYTSLPNGEPEGYTFNDTLRSNFVINATLPLTGVFEGFDDSSFPQEGWTLSSSSILQWGETPLTSYSGTGAGVKNNYEWSGAYGSYYDLQLPLLNVSGLSNTDFSFDYAYTAYPGNMGDSLQVSVSEDCGATWETLFYKGGYSLRTAPYTRQIFYPDEPNEWKHESYSLAAFEGNILIRFRARYGNSNNLYLDNILVGSPVGVPEVVSRQSSVVSYPNPTGGIVDFRLSMVDVRDVTLKIYDGLGREVATMLDEQLPAGEHTVEFDMSGLPAGIYFYRLTTDDRRLTTDDRRLTTETGKIVKF